MTGDVILENAMRAGSVLARPLASPLVKAFLTGSEATLPERLRAMLVERLKNLPWQVRFVDWTGRAYTVGGDEAHWGGEALDVHIKTVAAGRDLLTLDGFSFLERFLASEVDFSSFYMLHDLKNWLDLTFINPLHVGSSLASVLAFQDTKRAGINVSNHYDMPEEAVRRWLDSEYASYSCAIFEDPHNLDREELRRIGKGREDYWDSLEKAQWRKFKDAAEWLNPADGETTLDVGCGYPGYLRTHMELFPNAGKVIGWTHSDNQVRYGIRMLETFDPVRYELHRGDYREEFEGVTSGNGTIDSMRTLRKRPRRVFDHIQSSGMICHVGPGKGLVEYVKNCRALIRKGGRMIHHCLMNPWSNVPLDFHIGSAFCKKYVWPGFHWYTLGEHINALQQNGFKVMMQRDLTAHYAKTTMAWAERYIANAAAIREAFDRCAEQRLKAGKTPMGTEGTFRSMQLFLGATPGGFLTGSMLLNRLYCEAV